MAMPAGGRAVQASNVDDPDDDEKIGPAVVAVDTYADVYAIRMSRAPHVEVLCRRVRGVEQHLQPATRCFYVSESVRCGKLLGGRERDIQLARERASTGYVRTSQPIEIFVRRHHGVSTLGL
jgi:hypothetical protein